MSAPVHTVRFQAARCVRRGLLFLALAALPAFVLAQVFLRPAPPLLIRDLFTPGLRAQVWTVKGEALWLDGIRLTTPADFDTLRSDDPIARFSATTALPEGSHFFGQIQKLIIGELTTTFLGSNPQEMEYYRLGDVRTAVPPPPDWRRVIGQIPPWHRAVAVSGLEGLPFLSHSVCCWDGRPRADQNDLSVYLFRQSFRLERPDTIARATLRLASGVDVIEASFNEAPLHLAGGQKLAIAEFEVSPLLREGDNIFALKVRGRPAAGAAPNFGLAFHLEVVRRKDALTPVPPLDPAAALLLSRRGDRVWGSVQDLRADRILLDSHYGPYSIAWDDCAGLLFPSGWQPPRPRPGLKEKLFPNAPLPSRPELKLNTLPLATLPRPLQDCLLLTEGRVTTARPTSALGGKLFFEGEGNKQYSMPLEEVLGVFPPRPEQASFKRPPREVAILYCQASTRTGEVFGGLLRQISPESVVVETEGGQMMTIPADNVATIQFPYHSATLGVAEARQGPIVLLPRAGEAAPASPAYDADSLGLQAACFTIGAEFKNLTPEDLANPATLTPARYPVLVSLDSGGAYLDTFFGPGDARQALARYIEAGGVVVALSRGGVFRAPVANQGGGKFAPAPSKPDLAESLGVRTLLPVAPARAGAAPTGAVAFDQPPNEGGELFFQRANPLPEGLSPLPRRIDLSPLESAAFYPVMPLAAGRENVLYSLSDARGRAYGPALTLFPRGRGWLVVIDHLLWESRVDDRPFPERVLPLLLHWAFTNSAH